MTSFNRLSSKLVVLIKEFAWRCFVAQICAISSAGAHFGAYISARATNRCQTKSFGAWYMVRTSTSSATSAQTAIF